MPTLMLYKDRAGWYYTMSWTGTEMLRMSPETMRRNEETRDEAYPEEAAEREKCRQENEEYLRQEEEYSYSPPRIRRDKNPQPMVYFIGTGQTVKIGYSTQPIDHRLRNLQCGNPENLKVLLVIPGTQQTEQELHKRFSPLRIRGKGEWFRAEGELLEFIQKRGEL